MRRRKKAEDFFTDLGLMSGFFDDLDDMIRKDIREIERQQRYEARRNLNAAKARRIHTRIVRVRAFDPWAKTEHIKPDVFGDNYERKSAIMALENKRLRIHWVLWAMYHYWMFDESTKGAKRYGKRYSLYRKLFDRHVALYAEKLKQDKWDKKRAKVRARRKNTPRAKMPTTRVQDVIDHLEPVTTESLPKELTHRRYT